MSEFKVDKLGWYERRDGKKVKVIDFKPEFDMSVTVYNKELHVLESYFTNGRITLNRMREDLIKYIGPELPKEPRKFEFEGFYQNF